MQAQKDQVLRIDFRGLLGAGIKVKLVNKKRIILESAALYMYEYEEEKDTSVTHTDHRLSLNYFLRIGFGKIIAINQFTYYQPKLDFFNDYRISSGALINLKISKHFFSIFQLA